MQLVRRNRLLCWIGDAAMMKHAVHGIMGSHAPHIMAIAWRHPLMLYNAFEYQRSVPMVHGCMHPVLTGERSGVCTTSRDVLEVKLC